jgi:hypothetical protein
VIEMTKRSTKKPRLTFQHGFYDAESLRKGLHELEAAYAMGSSEFYAAYSADEVLEIPRFHQSVWANYFEEFQRLESEGDVVERAGKAAVILSTA